MRSGRGTACLLVLTIAALQLACTETDDTLNTEVGVTILTTSDPDFRFASLDEPGIQAAEWRFTRAELTAADRLYDLTAGVPCDIFGSAVVLPGGRSKCAGGVVVTQPESPVTVALGLELTMTVRRAVPLTLAPQDDQDGDGVLNDTDLCRLIPDPGQEDDDQNGIGDACEGTNPFTGEIEIDNDGDGVIDDLDNCVYIENSNQRDTPPYDGIGDACDGTVTAGAPLPEVADVTIGMSTDLRLDLGAAGFDPQAQRTLLIVVDFSHASALTCDWNAGQCELDPSALELCFSDALAQLSSGCS